MEERRRELRAETTAADIVSQVVMLQAHKNGNIISVLNKQVRLCSVLK